MKKKKRFLLTGLILLGVSALCFFLAGTTQEQANEIAQLNENRAEVHRQKANMYQFVSIALGVGGVVFLTVALVRKDDEWSY